MSAKHCCKGFCFECQQSLLCTACRLPADEQIIDLFDSVEECVGVESGSPGEDALQLRPWWQHFAILGFRFHAVSTNTAFMIDNCLFRARVHERLASGASRNFAILTVGCTVSWHGQFVMPGAMLAEMYLQPSSTSRVCFDELDH